MKSSSGFWAFAMFVVVAVFGSLIYMKTSYGTTEPCVAMGRAIAEEMPAALDELAKRYPLKVGIARGLSFLVDDVDAKIAEMTNWLVSEGLRNSDEPPSPFSCFGSLIMTDLNRASFRAELVDSLDRSLGLSAPARPSRPRPASSGAEYLTCLVNDTPGDVYFSYRWGARGDWEEVKLQKGYNHWFSNAANLPFNVRFDDESTTGYQGASYTLERARSSARSCDGAKRYTFRWDDGTLKLYGG